MPQQHLSNEQDFITPETLEQAFQQFNEVSSSLSKFYQGLEEKVTSLNQELADTRSQKIREHEERERITNRLENLLRVLPGGVIVIDGEGLVQECNPAAVEILGMEIINFSWRQVVLDAFIPSWDDSHDVRLKNGRFVNISTQSLGNEPGQIILITDVTETHHLQEQISGLRRVSAMGEMAAALAHQIRTPLSSALLYVSNLGAGFLEDERRKRFTKKALSALQHLEILVEEMLLFARGGNLSIKPVVIKDVLDEFIEQQQGEKNNCVSIIEMNYRCDEKLLIDLCKDAFNSALQNLVNNACQANEGKTRISMNIECRDDEFIIFSITDDGPGIPKSIRSRLFEPFVSTRENGNGLGLAVVDAVIKAHKGTVNVEDAEPTGTSFIITLPITNHTNQQTNKKKSNINDRSVV